MVSLVNETVELLGLRLDHVITIHEAVMALRCCRYEVMITAVSTSQANLFDESSFDERTCQMVYKSQLLQQAICESPWTYRIVYGYEAMEFEDVRYACFDCGADAVVNSSDDLFTSLFGFLTPPPTTNSNRNNYTMDHYHHHHPLHIEREEQLLELADGIVTRRLQLQQGASMAMTNMTPNNNNHHHHHHLGIADETAISVRPQENLSLASQLQGDRTDMSTVTRIARNSDQLQQDYLLYKSKVFQGPGTGPSLRVVHLSDTVGHHRSLILPEGDLLLHGGNFTDGKTSTCLEQFSDFLDWIHEEALPKYRQVAFIAGDRDFFLDIIACKYNAASREAQKILNRFLSRHKSVAFLENTSISFRGITIHGSSTTLLKGSDVDEFKANTMGAFERKFETYVRPEIDDECDILLTHRPPSHMFVQVHYVLPTDHLYRTEGENSDANTKKKRVVPLFHKNKSTSELKKTKQTPRLHAFGHYGNNFGVEERSGTLLLNGSQDRILRDDKNGASG